MYRQVAAIFLFFSFAAHSFGEALQVLNYYVNTAAFAKNCENKARPAMHCNGKCQLMKKLKEEEEKKEQQSPERKAENKNEVVSSKSFFTIIESQKISPLTSFHSYFPVSIPSGSDNDIFHPPALV